MRQKEFEEGDFADSETIGSTTDRFAVGDVYEDLFTGNLVVVENITKVTDDNGDHYYADICPVHGERKEHDTRKIPDDLQNL